jgi:hypothetical protein
MKKIPRVVLALICAVFLLLPSLARSAEMTLAGFAFAGDYKSAASRFPYSFKTFERLKGSDSLSAQVLRRSQNLSNPAIDIRAPASLVNLKQSDQALMAVLLLTDEIVSSENYGAYYKTFVNLRADVLIFDYKNQNVVRSYPVSTVLFDATPSAPSPERLRSFVEELLLREDGNGLISLFVSRLSTATLPQDGSKTIQVRQSEVAPEALALMPEALRGNPKVAESLVADLFASVLSAKLGVPLLPSSIGHAVGGVMSLRLENGDDMKLKLGEGDYLFDVRLNKFAKIKTEANSVGTAYVYGAYTSLRFYEPTLGTDFIDTDLKNGESVVVPATQVATDDFPAYQDAIRGLFQKFSDALQQPDSKWIRAAASAENIASQLESTNDILRKCK